MSMNQRINRIISKNTHMSQKAIMAGKVLADFYENEGKHEFAIDLLKQYGDRLLTPLLTTSDALTNVESCVDDRYEPQTKSDGINEARILVYTMDMGTMFNESLADPASVKAIMAAMIDVAYRVNLYNKKNSVDKRSRVSINKALGITARIGYRRAVERGDYLLSPYAIASEAMEQIDGDIGDYGSVFSYAGETCVAMNGEAMQVDPPIFTFNLGDFDEPDEEPVTVHRLSTQPGKVQSEKPAAVHRVATQPEEKPAAIHRVATQPEKKEQPSKKKPTGFGGSLWGDDGAQSGKAQSEKPAAIHRVATPPKKVEQPKKKPTGFGGSLWD